MVSIIYINSQLLSGWWDDPRCWCWIDPGMFMGWPTNGEEIHHVPKVYRLHSSTDKSIDINHDKFRKHTYFYIY